jgi:hypothetical protein
MQCISTRLLCCCSMLCSDKRGSFVFEFFFKDGDLTNALLNHY